MTPSSKTTRQPIPQQAGPFGYHWRSIGRVLWEGKFKALVITIVLTIAAGLVVRSLPSVFKAECLLLVVGQKIPEKYVSPSDTSAPQERLATISHLILSDERLESIIEEFHLYDAERKSMPREDVVKLMREKDIELKPEAGLSDTHPDAIRISFENKDPQTAANVTNRLAHLIMAENSRSREKRAMDTSTFIDEQLGEARQTLDRLEAQVKQYKFGHSGELPEQESSLNGSMMRLQARLQGDQEAVNRADQARILVEGNLSQAESSLASLQQAETEAKDAAKRKAAATAAEATAQAAAVAAAKPKTRIETLQDELATLQLRYGPDHPEIRRRQVELADLKAADAKNPKPAAAVRPVAPPDLDATVTASLATAILGQKERMADLRAKRELAVKEVATADAERQDIGKEIESLQARIDRLPLREQEMASLTRDYEIAKANYKSLLDKKNSAEMAADMESSQRGEEYTLVEPARVPERPFKPKREMLYLGGAVLSLLIGFLVVLMVRLPRDKVLGEWELGPNVVILGRIPQIVIPKGEKAA